MAKKAARRALGKITRTRSQKKREKRLQHFNFAPKLAKRRNIEGWDEDKSLVANYRALGLAFDSNNIFAHPTLAYDNAEMQLVPEKTGIMTSRLEYLQSLPPPEPREVKSMNVQEQYQLQALIHQHADNYDAMQSDISLNIQQMTATKLQNRIELMFRLQRLAGIVEVSNDTVENNGRMDDSDLEEEEDEDDDFEAELERRFKLEEEELRKMNKQIHAKQAVKQTQHDKSVNVKHRGKATPKIVVPQLKQLVKTRVYSARSREQATLSSVKQPTQEQ